MGVLSYESVDIAERQRSKLQLQAEIESLSNRRHELAHEIGQTASGLMLDRDAGDLTATLAYLAQEMAALAKVIDTIAEAENELRELCSP